MIPLPIRGPCCLWCDSDLPGGPCTCPGCGRAVAPHNPDRRVGELADLMRETGAVIVHRPVRHPGRLRNGVLSAGGGGVDRAVSARLGGGLRGPDRGPTRDREDVAVGAP